MPVKQVSSNVLLSRSPNPSAIADFNYLTVYGDKGNYQARATRKINYVKVDIITPLKNFGNVTLDGNLYPTTSGADLFKGSLFRNAIMYEVTGNVRFDQDVPVEATLNFVPKQSNSQESSLTYALTNTDGGYGKKLLFRVDEGRFFGQVDSEFNFHSKVNWKLTSDIKSSNDLLTHLETHLMPNTKGQLQGSISIQTPFKELGIDSILVSTDLDLRASSGDIKHTMKIAELQTQTDCSWTWIPLQQMEMNIDTSITPAQKPTRQYTCSLKYQDHNVQKSTKSNGRIIVAMGIHLDVDSRWRLQSNATVRKVPHEFGANLNVRLPGPVSDMHKISCQYRGNVGATNDNLDLTYDVKYETDISERRFASRGQYRNVTDLQGAVRVEWGNDVKYDAAEANVQMLRKDLRREFSARLSTPLHAEDTMTGRGSYDVQDSLHLITLVD